MCVKKTYNYILFSGLGYPAFYAQVSTANTCYSCRRKCHHFGKYLARRLQNFCLSRDSVYCRYCVSESAGIIFGFNNPIREIIRLMSYR